MEVDCVSFRSRFRWHRTHGSDDGSDAINGRPSHPIIHNPPHFSERELRALFTGDCCCFLLVLFLLPGSNGTQQSQRKRKRVRHALHSLHAGAKRKQLGIRIQKPPSVRRKQKEKDEKGSCLKNEERRLFEVYQAS